MRISLRANVPNITHIYIYIIIYYIHIYIYVAHHVNIDQYCHILLQTTAVATESTNSYGRSGSAGTGPSPLGRSRLSMILAVKVLDYRWAEVCEMPSEMPTVMAQVIPVIGTYNI